ncbi:MAG: hypothetical protein HFI37_02995 [Lachnospiraceae bacterium]|nr:hypothetical protein [Lachnospiraceae bacterium]
MYKKVIGTVAAFLVSLCIAGGGLYIFHLVLEREGQMFLSERGSLKQKSFSEDGERKGQKADVSYEDSHVGLSEEELYLVTKNEEDSEMQYPHEPYYGQLSMEEAIQSGETWLKELKKQNPKFSFLVDDESLKASAYLSRPTIEEDGRIDSERILSIWTLDVYCEKADVILKINAVTGQVLRAYFNIYDKEFLLSDDEEKNLLNYLLLGLEMKTEQKMERREDEGFTVRLGDGRICGIIAIHDERGNSFEYSGYDKLPCTVQLYFSTNFTS